MNTNMNNILHEKYKENGFLCFIYRKPFGLWNAYIAVPRNHPWFGKNPTAFVTTVVISSGKYLSNDYYLLGFESQSLSLDIKTIKTQVKSLSKEALLAEKYAAKKKAIEEKKNPLKVFGTYSLT